MPSTFWSRLGANNRLARMAERVLDKFSAQNLPNTAWAFAIAGQQDEQLFKVLARMAE